MKISYNWLKELLPDLSKTPAQVADILTLHSFETVVGSTLAFDPHSVVARIVNIAAHPNADRLRLATITTGQEEITVVCGAPNIAVGDVVPFSPLGTKLTDEAGQEFVLKEASIRGVVSPGMLNSPRELGLGDWHGGIYLLPADTPVGSKLFDLMPADTILEADITPNRAHDCLSHLGVARELAAIEDLSVCEPAGWDLSSVKKVPDWTIEIQDPTHTRRYLGTYLTDIQVGPSPLWLQARLWAVGARPINNVVDITNYVMFESGNPAHAFDATKLPGKTIGVRRAHQGETIAGLDGNNYALTDTNVLITSQDQPVAIAGVMGGAATSVSPTTTEIFLEVANFAPFTIYQSATALKLRTESSHRFSKGISPEIIVKNASRVVQLLHDIAGATPVGSVDTYPAPQRVPTITFIPSQVTAVAGHEIPAASARTSLTRLGCTVTEQSSDHWQVTPPAERLDLVGPHDLVEEVIRLAGLHRIPAQSPERPAQPTPLPASVRLREQIKDALVTRGFIEVYNYSFEIETLARPLGLVNEQSLEVVNPVAPEERYLRQSLLPRLLENIVTNKAEIRQKKSSYSKSLFEVGTVFTQGEPEHEHVAGVSVDRSLAALVSTIVEVMREVMPTASVTSEDDPAGGYIIKKDAKIIGRVAEIPAADRLKLPLPFLREMPCTTFVLYLDKIT